MTTFKVVVRKKRTDSGTMWKKESPNLTDANRTETTLISDLTRVSASKDNALSTDEQTDGAESTEQYIITPKDEELVYKDKK